jgi:hypothetical protein
MSKNIKNLLIVLCLVGVAGQSEEVQAYSFDLAALQAVDPMTVGCSIAGAAGVYAIGSAVARAMESCFDNGWKSFAENKVIIAQRLKEANLKTAALHDGYDLYEISEQSFYNNINKYKSLNSINYGYQAVARFSRELANCIELLCYHDNSGIAYYYDCEFKDLALDDYRNMSWSNKLRTKENFLNCCVSTEFKNQFKALSAYHKQLHFHLNTLSHYAFLNDVVSLCVDENAIDVLGIYSFIEEANGSAPYEISFAIDKNLPYSSVVQALESCLSYVVDAKAQSLPWLNNEMKSFAPKVKSIMKVIKSSNEYTQERLAVVQSGKVWINVF